MHLHLQMGIMRLYPAANLRFQPSVQGSCFDAQLAVKACPVIHHPRNREQDAVQFLHGYRSFSAGYGVQPLGNAAAIAWWQDACMVAGVRAILKEEYGLTEEELNIVTTPIGIEVAA